MNQPLIIGIAGKAGHGKSAAQTILHDTYGYERINLADPVRRICMDMWGITHEQLSDSMLKEQTLPEWGFSPREAMQMVGTGMGRKLHPDTWVRKTLTTIKTAQAGQTVSVTTLTGQTIMLNPQMQMDFQQRQNSYQYWCVGDVRFPNEAEAIQAAGGKVIKIINPNVVDNLDHDSEHSVDLVVADITIHNDGSLDVLKLKLAQALDSLSVKSTYETSIPNGTQRTHREPVVNRVMLATGTSYAQATIAVSESGGNYNRAVEYLRRTMRMK